MMNEKQIKKIFLYVLLISIAVLILIPVLFLVLTSLKEPEDFYGRSVFALPKKIHWENFTDAFFKGNLYRYMFNGFLICLIKVPLGILIEALAAFGLTRLRIKFSGAIFIVFLIGMMVPMQITLIPLNIGLRALKLTNTYLGIITVYLAFGIPFGILVLRGFFRTIPDEIYEAGIIDGCSNVSLFFRITLPLSKSALSTLLILDGLSTWNEFLLISVLVTNDDMRTISAGLLNFIGENNTEYGLLTAGVLISIVPVLILYACFQRYFVEGLSGAIKG